MSLVQDVIDYLDSQPNGATLQEIRTVLSRPRVENGIHTAAKGGYIVSVGGRWYRTGRPRVKRLAMEERGVGEADTLQRAEEEFARLIGSARYEGVKVRIVPLYTAGRAKSKGRVGDE